MTKEKIFYTKGCNATLGLGGLHVTSDTSVDSHTIAMLDRNLHQFFNAWLASRFRILVNTACRPLVLSVWQYLPFFLSVFRGLRNILEASVESSINMEDQRILYVNQKGRIKW